jgi:methylmalonyl-CoA/ethylmalonyl-CoA epimerase
MNPEPKEKSTFSNMFQVGVVVKDIEKTIESLSRLGIGPFYSKMPPPTATSIYRGRPFKAADRVIIKATQLGNVELELIQPLEGGSPHRDYLESKGEGIQHLAFAVDNLENSVTELTSEGSAVVLDGRRPDGKGVAYVDLNIAGLIVELVKH